MYFVLAGILFSAYKFLSLTKQEHDQEQEWIEQEGNVYIKRMEAEKKERNKQTAGGDGE
jgi:Uma2 family endonuclease